MTDWSSLSQAYGNAADVPALLEQLTPESDVVVWRNLWDRLCHQGSVYSASIAALPYLADAAENWSPAQRYQPLALAANILLGGTEQQVQAVGEELRSRFQQICLESLAEHGTRPYDFIFLLMASRVFAGDLFWGERLECLIIDGEFPGVCPHCRMDLYLVIGRDGCYTTVDSWRRPEMPRAPINPNQGELPEDGQWLFSHAVFARQIEVAEWIRHLFGTSRCPACSSQFSVLDVIADS